MEKTKLTKLLTYWMAIGVTVLFVVLGVTASSHMLAAQHNRGAQGSVAAQQHFWQVVTGQDDPRSTVADKFGADLRAWDRPLDQFVGDANAYGGVSGDLDLRPMDSCEGDCGHLLPVFESKVAAAKSGSMPRTEFVKRHGISWIPLILTFLLVIGVPAGIVLGQLIQTGKSKETLSRQFPDEVRLIDKLRASGQLAGGTDRIEMFQLAKKLEVEIQERVNMGDSYAATTRTKALKKDAQDALSALEAGNDTIGED